MACNCGKTGQADTAYQFTAPDGGSKVYRTEVEANAAKIRAGGGTVQTVTK